MTRPEWAGFLALCLLSASVWLVEGAWPSLLPLAERQCLHEGIIGSVVCLLGWRNFARSRVRVRPWPALSLASVCLLGVPAMLAETTRGGVSEVTIAELFAMLPVAVVVLVPHFDLSRTGDTDANRLLTPALIGLAGTLLLLQFTLPDSWRQARLEAVVVLAVVVAAVASVSMYRLLAEFTVVEAVMLSCLANTAFWSMIFVASRLVATPGQTPDWPGVWNWHVVTTEAARAILFNLPQVVLLLWLMREIAPTRLAARFFVVPLLTLLEGYAPLRPEVTASSMVGAVLVIFGVWRMTTASERCEEPGLMLG